MKRIIAALLSLAVFLSGCSQTASTQPAEAVISASETLPSQAAEAPAVPSECEISENQATVSSSADSPETSDNDLIFSDFADPTLLQYVNNGVYAGLVDQFASEDYVIESIESIYVSQEYLDEIAYNSKANIFFGYTLEDIDNIYQGSKFIFTLGKDGTTVVQPFEDYDDTYECIIKNVATGTGVILICVTVSVATGGTGLSSLSMVMAASAKTATEFALLSGTIGGLAAGILEGVQSQDILSAAKAAAFVGSEGFKWGAISGAFVGGARKVSTINRAEKAVSGAQKYEKGSLTIPEDASRWRKAELRALNEQGGYEQLTYMNGKQVPFGTKGATRPDVVRFFGDHIEAVEVKCYNLSDASCRKVMYKELKREIQDRIVHLPAGSTQSIVLDVTDWNFDPALIPAVKNEIWRELASIYPKIPIQVVG